jgi:serine/threonine protein kinase
VCGPQCASHRSATGGRKCSVRAIVFVQAIDFGMAAKVGSPEFQGLAGTYRYMAPEIVNDRSYDEKVDLWSVGAIMYCILAGASQRRSIRRPVKCFTSLGCSHLSVYSMWPHVNATGTSSTHSGASRRAALTSCGTDFGFGLSATEGQRRIAIGAIYSNRCRTGTNSHSVRQHTAPHRTACCSRTL